MEDATETIIVLPYDWWDRPMLSYLDSLKFDFQLRRNLQDRS